MESGVGVVLFAQYVFTFYFFIFFWGMRSDPFFFKKRDVIIHSKVLLSSKGAINRIVNDVSASCCGMRFDTGFFVFFCN